VKLGICPTIVAFPGRGAVLTKMRREEENHETGVSSDSSSERCTSKKKKKRKYQKKGSNDCILPDTREKGELESSGKES